MKKNGSSTTPRSKSPERNSKKSPPTPTATAPWVAPLWRGPLILECELGGQRDVSGSFAIFCQNSAQLPENTWGGATLEHWRGGQKHLVSYHWLKHQPAGCTSVRHYAVLRHKREDDMFWQYCYIEVEAGRGTTPAQSKAAFERHRLKGECERRFSEVLSDLGLYHPPCHSLGANDAWYPLGAIAYNLPRAMKLLVLPEKDLAKRFRTIMQRLLLLPMKLKAHARQRSS